MKTNFLKNYGHTPSIPNNVKSSMGFNTSIPAINKPKAQEKRNLAEELELKFLGFIHSDIEKNPGHVKPFSSDLLNRARLLVANVEFDINETLCDEDD